MIERLDSKENIKSILDARFDYIEELINKEKMNKLESDLND